VRRFFCLYDAGGLGSLDRVLTMKSHCFAIFAALLAFAGQAKLKLDR
jgi:hypothetical protein